MPPPGETSRDVLVRDILRHLQEHPDASDKLEGICGWWLSPANRNCDPNVLRVAMESLVERGLISRIALGDGEFLYRSLKRCAGNHRRP